MSGRVKVQEVASRSGGSRWWRIEVGGYYDWTADAGEAAMARRHDYDVTGPFVLEGEVVPRSEAEAVELLALRLYDLMRDDDAEHMTDDDVEFVLRLRDAHPREETP